MGCSASKPTTLLHTKEQHNLPYCSSSPSSLSLEKETSSSSSSSSSYYSCSHCHSQPHPPPVARAFSLQTPLVHHPPSRKGDSHHLVSLTSSTYGSLLLQQPSKNPPFQPQSLPKTTHILKDTSDSPSLSPDSVINTWELMDGLDDDLDLHFQLGNPKAASFHHMGSDCSTKKLNACFDTAKSDEIDKPVPLSNSKPLWKHLSEESFLSNMDPNVVSSYRRALSSRQLGGKVYSFTKDSKSLGSVGSSPSKLNFAVGTFISKNSIRISFNPKVGECNLSDSVFLYVKLALQTLMDSSSLDFSLFKFITCFFLQSSAILWQYALNSPFLFFLCCRFPKR